MAFVTAFSVNSAAGCVAVALPDAALKQGAQNRNISAPLQDALTETLQLRGLEAKAFPSQQAETVMAQAAQANCQQVLFTSLSQERKSRWNKWISIGLSAGSHHSGGGIGVGISTDLGKSSAGKATTPVTGESLAEVQQLIREDDIITLNYELKRTDGLGTTGTMDFERKAAYDGDAVLQQLVEQISLAVAYDLAD